jgi:two-component sensor histidine kinase
MSASPDTIDAPNQATRALNRLLRRGFRPGSSSAITFAICCVMVALGVRLAFWLMRPDLVIFATYYPAVLLATLIGGWSAGIVAQVLGGIVAWLFYDPSFAAPAHVFGDQIGDFGLYGMSSGLIIWASEHYRRLIRSLDEEEHYRRLVVDELNHRLRNKFAVVHAILRHELRTHREVRTRILDRLSALAAADELLSRPEADVVDIREILSAELSHYGETRILAKGDHVELPAKHAAALTLILHELATNAAKHGALKLPDGQVSIGWRLESNTLEIEWTEKGGPPVSPPQRCGFGTGLFRRALDPFNGTIATSFEPMGIQCEICLDLPDGKKTEQGVPSPMPVALISRERMRRKHMDHNKESFMIEPDSNSNPSTASNPGDGYPPTRPGPIAVLIALGLIVAGLGIENWSDIVALTHSARIERALGL